MSATTTIDPRAVVHPDAQLGSDVFVGPYCVIGEDVSIGDRTRLEAHVVVQGPTELGPDNRISPMASVGGPPQDLKYSGEPTGYWGQSYPLSGTQRLQMATRSSGSSKGSGLMITPFTTE